MEEKITVDEVSEYIDITSEKLDEFMGEAEETEHISINEIDLTKKNKRSDESYG